MKHIYNIFVDAVIHNFNQIADDIKAKQKVFIVRIINRVFINKSLKSPQYIGFGNFMPECRPVEFDFNVHKVNITRKGCVDKHQSGCTFYALTKNIF